jgi:hypothetical protein
MKEAIASARLEKLNIEISIIAGLTMTYFSLPKIVEYISSSNETGRIIGGSGIPGYHRIINIFKTG